MRPARVPKSRAPGVELFHGAHRFARTGARHLAQRAPDSKCLLNYTVTYCLCRSSEGANFVHPASRACRCSSFVLAFTRWNPTMPICLKFPLTEAFHAKCLANVETFRKADFVDVSLGFIRFGLAPPIVRSVKAAFPTGGFTGGSSSQRGSFAARPFDHCPWCTGSGVSRKRRHEPQ